MKYLLNSILNGSMQWSARIRPDSSMRSGGGGVDFSLEAFPLVLGMCWWEDCSVPLISFGWPFGSNSRLSFRFQVQFQLASLVFPPPLVSLLGLPPAK
jgi:hypothetical protein